MAETAITVHNLRRGLTGLDGFYSPFDSYACSLIEEATAPQRLVAWCPSRRTGPRPVPPVMAWTGHAPGSVCTRPRLSVAPYVRLCSVHRLVTWFLQKSLCSACKHQDCRVLKCSAGLDQYPRQHLFCDLTVQHYIL